MTEQIEDAPAGEPLPAGPWYYAQLDVNGVCIAVTQTSGPIDELAMFPIESLDTALVGKLRDGDEWLPGPAPVPAVVTMRQARLALLALGLLDDVEAAINALPSPQKEAARIEWEYSGEVHRDRPFVLLLAPVLGLDSDEVDQLFTTAAAL